MFDLKNRIITVLIITTLRILSSQTAHAAPPTAPTSVMVERIESARAVAHGKERVAKRQLARGFKADSDATLRSLEKHLAVEMGDLVDARMDSTNPAMKRKIDHLIMEVDAQMRRVGVLRGLITISLRYYEGFQQSE